MYSLSFPKIFAGSKTKLVKDKEAAKNNLKLVLMSTKRSLLGDPYFGSNIKKFLYEPNDIIMREMIMDEVYTAIRQYVPQVLTERNNIVVNSDKEVVTVDIYYKYLNDATPDMFSIQLTEE